MKINTLAKLYRDYIEKHDKQPNCIRNPSYSSWECCSYHINLNEENKKLKGLAKPLGVKSDGYTFSVLWWFDAGDPYMHNFMKNHKLPRFT